MNSEINENKLQESLDVLIIDDEMDICQLLVLILRNKNISSKFTNSLYEAKEFLSKTKPRMIFLDNHLSDGLGIDFIDQIKTLAPETKIVMITAHSTEANKKTALEKGAIHFIGKPFNTDEINETISKFL